jgi:DNA-binding LytR/AlgR family response regulator
MTPQQITDALEEIISNIADAHILIHNLEQAFEVAAKADQAVDVVYGDIWMDAGLSAAHKSLRLMERQLCNALDITLPEHFERLRKGEP